MCDPNARVVDGNREGDVMVAECAFCHETKPCEWAIDPYNHELYGDEDWDWACPDCLVQRAWDV